MLYSVSVVVAEDHPPSSVRSAPAVKLPCAYLLLVRVVLIVVQVEVGEGRYRQDVSVSVL